MMMKEIILTKIQARLLELLKQGDKSRNELCEALGYPKKVEVKIYRHNYKTTKYEHDTHEKRTTVYDNLLKLMKYELVEKYPVKNGKRGREVVKWRRVQ